MATDRFVAALRWSCSDAPTSAATSQQQQQAQWWPLEPGRTVLGRKWPPLPEHVEDHRISRQHCEINFSAAVGLVTLLALGRNPVYVEVGSRKVAVNAGDDPFFVRESDAEGCQLALLADGPRLRIVIRAGATAAASEDVDMLSLNEATLAVPSPAALFAQPLRPALTLPDVDMAEGQDPTATVAAGAQGHLDQASPMDVVEYSQVAPLTRNTSFTREISLDQIKIIRKIGAGTCGVVFLAQWLGARVAVKKVVMSLIHGDAWKEFQAETSMLKKLRHPNVVLFIGIVGKSAAPSSVFESDDFCIVTEFLAKGSLQDVLSNSAPALPLSPEDNRPRMSPSASVKMALDVATGISYLHASKVIHRDLKSANCLVASDGTVKIADLGLARFVSQSDDKNKTFCGTLTHCAPEILCGSGYSGFAADVYSFAVIVWEIITHAEPYQGMSHADIVLQVTAQKCRPPMPALCHEILDRLKSKHQFRTFEVTRPPPEDILSAPELALLGLAQICEGCWLHAPEQRPSMSKVVDVLVVLHNEVSRRESSGYAQLPQLLTAAPVPTEKASQPIVRRELSGPIESSKAKHDASQPEDRSNSTSSRDDWTILPSDLSFTDQLTENDIAVTWRGLYRSQIVTVKVFKQKLGGSEQDDFVRELDILSKVRSTRISYFYGAALSPKPLIVTEHVPHTLVDVLSMTDAVRIDWETVFTLARGVALGLLHLHSWLPPVILRTLAPSNILCDISSNFFVKLSNFNLARVNSGDQTKLRAPASVYQAPESLLSNAVTPSCDMFSFGIILWEIVHRCLSGSYAQAFSEYSELKFDFQKVLAISKRNLRPTIPPNTPKPLVSLITRCWDADPSSRPASFVSVIEEIESLKEAYQKQRNRKK